jgi:hypothetical protein
MRTGFMPRLIWPLNWSLKLSPDQACRPVAPARPSKFVKQSIPRMKLLGQGRTFTSQMAKAVARLNDERLLGVVLNRVVN